MDPDRWSRIEELFHQASQLSGGERDSLLQTACGSDRHLRDEVEGLLEADADAEDFLQTTIRSACLLLEEEHEGTSVTPDHIGRFAIRGIVGEGGFGKVFEGWDPRTLSPVAIKTCRASQKDHRRRFHREGQIAASLDHPHITRVLETSMDQDTPYLVQELLPGRDLDEILEDGEELELSARAYILAGVAKALGYAHTKGVLHRDIKPGNIRVLPSGQARVMDFGIAKIPGSNTSLTAEGTTLGTAGYQAPEHLLGEPNTKRSEIFSFGVLAYELLTGSNPFSGSNHSQVFRKILELVPPPITELSPECPSELARAVQECLAKKPEDRPSSLSAVLEALGPLLSDERRGPAHD